MTSLSAAQQQEVDDFIQRMDADRAALSALTLNETWIVLQNSEALLIAVMDHQPLPAAHPAYVEFGLSLYFLNTYLPSWLITLLGIPASNITASVLSGWESEIKGEGAVAEDGTFLSDVPYGQFDLNWSIALFYYIDLELHKLQYANFGFSPATPTVKTQDTMTIAVMGDWGSGSWDDGPVFSCPSVLVGQAISSLKPDITIHVGDVYYSGLPFEEKNNLLASFPSGSQYSFTMNSNHEMYYGGNGYFGTAIAPTQNLFKQNATSYFSFVFQDWLIIGLDSAYYDDSFFFMEGAIAPINNLKPAQESFVQQQVQKNPGKKVILFTHHIAISLDGSAINNTLFNQVLRAFNNYMPDFWYYGHTHNGIVYNDNSVMKNYNTVSGKIPKARCMGHGALPFGKATGLYNNQTGKMISTVDYFAQTSIGADTNGRQKYRVLNGFSLLTLKKGSITETVYEVKGVKGGFNLNQAWTNTINY